MAKLPHLPNFFLITCFIVYVAGSKILLATPVFLAQQNKKHCKDYAVVGTTIIE